VSRSEAVARDLIGLLGDGSIVRDDADRSRYERGYRYGSGRALAIVRPASTQDVASLLRYCYRHDIRVVAQGANTGLVAASTPDESGDQLVLSLDRLLGIDSFDAHDRMACALAGTRLSTLNREVRASGLFCPIDLGADPSLGGMVASNTGGSRLIRYGDVQRNLMGLEVVLADEHGTVLSDLHGLRKDNSGVDLKQLFVGTGGAFGVITRVQLELHRVPSQVAAAIVVPTSHAAIPALIESLESRVGELLSAFEGMSRNALHAGLEHNPRARNPFGSEELPEYATLIELSSTLPARLLDLSELLATELGECLEDSSALINDARFGPAEDLWAIRHSISDGVKARGRVIAFDVSVRRSKLPSLRAELLALVRDRFPYLLVHDFGHCGDGGDHFNIVWPPDAATAYDERVVAEVRNLVYDCVVKRYEGSFSAEHGIGPYNVKYYERYTSDAEKRLSRQMKSVCDPKGLLGAVASWPG
jgi:FAD/FMN-containing dehydrogenase